MKQQGAAEMSKKLAFTLVLLIDVHSEICMRMKIFKLQLPGHKFIKILLVRV
jgi:hypothetical protein